MVTALANQYEDDILEAAQQMGERERTYLQNARKAYEELNPLPKWEEPIFEEKQWVEPVYVAPVFRKEMGLQATAMTASVIGSILLSAFTVGLILYISAVNTDVRLIEQTASPFLQWLSSSIPALFFIGGLVAVEGYAFSHEFAVGKEKGQRSFEKWPIIAAYAIMITTGLLRSLAITDLTQDHWLYRITQAGVIISLTLGIPVLIGYGARNLGVFRNQFDAMLVSTKEAFDAQRRTDFAAHEANEERRRNMFDEKRLERMAAHQLTVKDWYDLFRKYWEKEYSGHVLGVDRGAPPVARKSRVAAVVPQDEKFTYTNAVRIWLRASGLYPEQVGLGKDILPSAVCDGVRIMFPADVTDEVDKKGRTQINTYLGRLDEDVKKARINGTDWLRV